MAARVARQLKKADDFQVETVAGGLGEFSVFVDDQVTSLSEMIARLAQLPLAAEPGTAHQYSVGYDIMGLIIERVSGKSLAIP
jgi:CubicO group peptidase (beta-lactamase class C family)